MLSISNQSEFCFLFIYVKYSFIFNITENKSRFEYFNTFPAIKYMINQRKIIETLKRTLKTLK